MASSVSVRVPIWLTLIRMLLVQPSAMPLRQPLGVGDEEVVADDLDLAAQRLGERRVAGPVVLVERVLDRDDRVLVDPGGEQVDHLLAGEDLVGGRLPELVALLVALVEELGAGAVERDGDVLVAAGRVAGLVDGVEDELDRLLVVEVGGEAAFVADVGVVAGLLEHALELVEDLGDHADALGERSWRRRA